MESLKGYCMKTKQQEAFVKASIEKTSKGGYMAKGETAEGHKMCAMLSEANALKAIESGLATKGF